MVGRCLLRGLGRLWRRRCLQPKLAEVLPLRAAARTTRQGEESECSFAEISGNQVEEHDVLVVPDGYEIVLGVRGSVVGPKPRAP